MAPIWGSYVEKGRTSAILFVVDSSCPECIGSATIHLVNILDHVLTRNSAPLPVMIVFSKTDLKSARSLMEIQYLMRLESILSLQGGLQMIQHVPFNVVTKDNVETILDWCMQFATLNNVAQPRSEASVVQ